MLGTTFTNHKVYIACGYTDLRQGIDSLAVVVQKRFNLDPMSKALFLFCGRRRDRIKGLNIEQPKAHVPLVGKSIL